ncbi:MAG: hypothetical protein KatS3mg105_0080 [Gemmatales bacterium]|nr:MAG: hypothetical protein KatS3mg105_0080 [Gemmatales bacterium]
MPTYIALAISDSMFPAGTFRKKAITANDVKSIIDNEEVVSCVNPSHRSTIDALKQRYGLEIPVPEKPAKITLRKNDNLIVCTVLGLPRETREFSQEEIERASFTFSLWTIQTGGGRSSAP